MSMARVLIPPLFSPTISRYLQRHPVYQLVISVVYVAILANIHVLAADQGFAQSDAMRTIRRPAA
jgi:hypothetical protein